MAKGTKYEPIWLNVLQINIDRRTEDPLMLVYRLFPCRLIIYNIIYTLTSTWDILLNQASLSLVFHPQPLCLMQWTARGTEF